MNLTTFNHNQKSTRSCGNHGLAGKRGPLAAALLALTAVAALLTNCGRHRHDSRLERIAAYVSDNPERAIASLDSIDASELDDPDRAFHDLLTIKARDKAYITHTSDSLIRCVIEYYTRHDDSALTPEALYYGGRVYSDLGDYPTSLSYFQQALELLPKNAIDQDLRSRVISQISGLLDELRLFDEAIPYVEESIEISRQLNDTVGEVQDLQLLGVINLRAKHLEAADSCFRLALSRSYGLPAHYSAKSKMYMAGIKYELGQADSALLYIHNILEVIKPTARNNVLAYGAEIYMKNRLYDSAYIYAHELINSPNPINKNIGYAVIFSDSISSYLDTDSLRKYTYDYHNSLERSFNEHKAQLAIAQQSLYNYDLHEKRRRKAEERNNILKSVLTGVTFISLLMLLVVLSLKNRNRKNIIELRAALQNIEKLEQSLGHPQTDLPADPTETAEELKEKLKVKLCALYESNPNAKTIPIEIQRSASYKKLSELISQGKELKESDMLWKELESDVLGCSPKFKDNLQLLVGGRLASFDLHTAILIKCGVTPTQMTVLLNRSKGTISSRRESLSQRIFGEKKGTKVIDGIIRLL